MDEREFSLGWAKMEDRWGRKPDSIRELYWSSLADLPPGLFTAASVSAIQQEQFFPSVDQIRSKVGMGLQDQIQSDWEKILSLAPRYSQGQSSYGLTPLEQLIGTHAYAALQQVGGANAITNSTHDQKSRMFADFSRIWLSLQRRAQGAMLKAADGDVFKVLEAMGRSGEHHH